MHPNQALFANEAFYLAFNQANYAAMEAVWSARDDLLCLHPGWPALQGREVVLQSWQDILRKPQANLSMFGASVTLIGDTALVLCYEQLGGTCMVATNVFVQENDQPLLLHHQAGPCARPEDIEGTIIPASH